MEPILIDGIEPSTEPPKDRKTRRLDDKQIHTETNKKPHCKISPTRQLHDGYTKDGISNALRLVIESPASSLSVQAKALQT